MELADSIKSACSAVEESGVPEQMQELAFKEALRALLGAGSESGAHDGGHPTPTLAGPIASPNGHSKGAEDNEHDNALSEIDVLQRVSAETEVPVDKLEKVFHIDDQVVKLIGPHSKYGSTTTDQARSVAQIVTVVRKLGLGHTDTSFEIIKEACESKHCYDSKNFASRHIPNIEGFVVKGEKKSRRLEAKGNGISAFPTLIDSILGES